MWNALIVDDEPPIRSELHYLLDIDGRCSPIREVGSATEAIAAIVEDMPDIIFLDISMPGTDGMKLAETLHGLKRPPLIVIVTAYAEYAADAFDLDVVDYVLKPIETDRLSHALARVEHALAQRDGQRENSSIPRIAIDINGRKTFIPASDIVYVEANADASYVVSTQGSSLVNESILSFEKRLVPEGFLRVHRSYLVNLEYVRNIEVADSGLLELSLETVPVRIPVSRRRTSFVKRALGIS